MMLACIPYMYTNQAFLCCCTTCSSTGSAAGQIAKQLGCRVVGTAGGADKVNYITKELGFDVGIDYRQHDSLESMKHALKEVPLPAFVGA